MKTIEFGDGFDATGATSRDEIKVCYKGVYCAEFKRQDLLDMLALFPDEPKPELKYQEERTAGISCSKAQCRYYNKGAEQYCSASITGQGDAPYVQCCPNYKPQPAPEVDVAALKQAVDELRKDVDMIGSGLSYLILEARQ